MTQFLTSNFEIKLTSTRGKTLNFEIISPLKNEEAANKHGE